MIEAVMGLKAILSTTLVMPNSASNIGIANVRWI